MIHKEEYGKTSIDFSLECGKALMLYAISMGINALMNNVRNKVVYYILFMVAAVALFVAITRTCSCIRYVMKSRP